ncbi:MAG: adenosine deaminase [Enterococcus sp.]
MMEQQVKDYPKIELHCHLDGSIRVATLKQMATKLGRPTKELDKVVAPEKCRDLNQYLESFSYVLPLLQNKENLQLAAYDVMSQAAEENVCYIEIRFAPLLHQENGLSVPEILEAVLAGIKQAQAEFDIVGNLLICGMRHHEESANLALVDQVVGVDEKIVGFDFAGDEAQFPNSAIASTVKKAKAAGLQITLHSGECGCAHNVVEAIQLGATRIGHGVAAKDDSAVMEFCREHDTLLEMCPTSNLQTNAIASWSEYPLRRFLDAGIKCCINTDNRTVSATNLTNEYQLLMEHCQLTLAEMQQLNQNAVDGSFASDEVKVRLSEKLLIGYSESE